jgi:hypothetical protein
MNHIKLETDKDGNPIVSEFTLELLKTHLSFELSYIEMVPKKSKEYKLVSQRIEKKKHLQRLK